MQKGHTTSLAPSSEGAFACSRVILGEFDHVFDGEEDVFFGGAAGEVGNRKIEALEDGAGDGEASDLLEGFVDEVARVEIRGDEDVGATGNGGVGRFFLTDTRVDGGVELEFAVDEDLLILGEGGIFRRDDFFDGAELFERFVGAAATESGERKQGDARLVAYDFAIGLGGLADDFGELLGGRIFAGGHIGEEIGFVFGSLAGGAEEGIS